MVLNIIIIIIIIILSMQAETQSLLTCRRQFPRGWPPTGPRL